MSEERKWVCEECGNPATVVTQDVCAYPSVPGLSTSPPHPAGSPKYWCCDHDPDREDVPQDALNGDSIIEQLAKGACDVHDFHNHIARWHASDSELSLHEWLGMTRDEYALFVEQPDGLDRILERRRYEDIRG